MSTPTITPPNATRRWPLPWPPVQHASSVIAPHILKQPDTPQPLHLTVTTGISIEAPSTIDVAVGKATRLSEKELDTALAGPSDAARMLTLGRGNQEHWITLCTALNVAKAIESGGTVRGLTEHLVHIERALNSISRRACKNEQLDSWSAPALYATEIDAVHLLVTLYKYQLKQLAYAEYQAAWRLATARVQSSQGQVYHRQQLEEGTP